MPMPMPMPMHKKRSHDDKLYKKADQDRDQDVAADRYYP